MATNENFILGIESSCDETAAAVVGDGRRILSSVVASQVDIHRKYGGVVPELASREHLRQIVPVVREALEQSEAHIARSRRHRRYARARAVGALLVGMTYGKVDRAGARQAADRCQSSRRSCPRRFSEAHAAGLEPVLPAVCLIVSGGHTVLYHVTAESKNGASAFLLRPHRRHA